MFEFLRYAYYERYATQPSEHKVLSYRSPQSPRYRQQTTANSFFIFSNISWSLASMLQPKLFHWLQYDLCTSHDSESNFVQQYVVCRYVHTCVCMWVSVCCHLLGPFSQLRKIPDLTKRLVFSGLLFGPIARFIVLNIKLTQHGSALHELS